MALSFYDEMLKYHKTSACRLICLLLGDQSFFLSSAEAAVG